MLSWDYQGVKRRFLYVRWLTETMDPDPEALHLKLVLLQWESRSRRRNEPFYSLISLATVQGPAYMMPDPRNEEQFFYNKYVCE